jgi:hypothetical protein
MQLAAHVLRKIDEKSEMHLTLFHTILPARGSGMLGLLAIGAGAGESHT